MGGMVGKVALVTGGTSGIGRACAERFVREGAKVVIAGRRREAGQAAADALGERCVFVAADVLREADVRHLVDTTLERFGRLDCVVSNAGTTSETTSIVDSAPESFDRDLALHVRAPYLAMKYAAPSMIARGSGSFVNVSSISAIRAGYNTFGYEVGKAALGHLTRCAALELGEKGVRVNAISPGPTLTGIFMKAGGADPDAADREARSLESAFLAILPSLQAVPGMVQPSDIADAVLFLASDAARFVNGHDLVVDGGITAGRPASTMKASWEALAAAAG